MAFFQTSAEVSCPFASGQSTCNGARKAFPLTSKEKKVAICFDTQQLQKGYNSRTFCQEPLRQKYQYMAKQHQWLWLDKMKTKSLLQKRETNNRTE